MAANTEALRRSIGTNARLAAAIALVLVLAVTLCGARPLWEPDEGRYAEAAREMLRYDDFLVPRVSGAPHLTKPPLTYWLTSAGLAAFGVNAFGARIALALAFVATAACVLALARTLRLSETAARCATLVYASSALPFAAGHILTTDTFVVLFQAIAVLCAWKVWSGAKSVGSWRTSFWLALGAAFLTKGPVGLLPLLVVVVHASLCRPRRRFVDLCEPIAILAFVVIAAGWFALLWFDDPAHLDRLVTGEFFGHIAATAGKTPEPFWIYLPILAGGALPWVFLWWPLARDVARRARTPPFSERALFCALWFAVPLIVFTLARARMAFYVLPLFLPLALATGVTFERRLLPALARSSRARVAAVATAVTWVSLLVTFLVYPDDAVRSGSYERLARHIGDAEDGAPARLGYVKRMSTHTLEFALDRVACRIPGHVADAVIALPLRDADGTRPVLLLSEKQARRYFASADFAADPFGIEIVGEQRGTVAIRRAER